MTELKFKLKKAGKCVGYMKIAPPVGGAFLWLSYREPGDEKWRLEPPIELQAFDSIHPFVCLDRSRQGVYEGDYILKVGRDGATGEKYRILWEQSCVEYVMDNDEETDPQIMSEWIELVPDEVTP